MKDIVEIHEDFRNLQNLSLEYPMKIYLARGLEARLSKEKNEMYIEPARKLYLGILSKNVSGEFKSYTPSKDPDDLGKGILELSNDGYSFKLKLNQIRDYDFLSRF